MHSSLSLSSALCFAAVSALGGAAHGQTHNDASSESADAGLRADRPIPESTDAEPSGHARATPAAVEVEADTTATDALDAAQPPSALPGSENAAAAQHAPNPFVLGAYAEAFYQCNFNNPSNGLTNFRGFDNRHNSFTLSNVAVDAQWDYKRLIGRVTLQAGHTPSTYYLAEPQRSGSDGANASGAELWKYIQQAYAGYRFGVGNGLTLSAGTFLSPIGPESIAVKDSWNWSRSNLFFGLPFYHTGVRATYAITDEWAITVAGYNGWNSVVDNNNEKSLSAQLTYTRDDLVASILYFGGVERAANAPEGRAWRHLFDAHVTWHATPRLSLLAQANGGFEPNELGVSAWVAGAMYARFRIVKPLFFVVRGDAFYEHVAQSSAVRASPIFWPAPWVSSGTATIDYRPHDRVSFRLEYRHDQAGSDMFFGGRVAGDGSDTAFVPNRASQDTLTVGATTWF